MADLLRFFPRPRPRAAAVLVGFPPAGSGASAFSAWPASLPTWLDVCAVSLPGREERIAEPGPASIADVAGSVASELAALDRPVALLGHSLGAWIAYETLLRLRADRVPVLGFFPAAARPPHLGDRPTIGSDPASLIAYLRDLGGTPPEIFANPEMLDLVLHTLRTDLALALGYPPIAELVDVPTTVLHGTEDRGVTAALAERWRDLVSAPCETVGLRGGHFFVHSARAEVIACVMRRMRDQLRSD